MFQIPSRGPGRRALEDRRSLGFSRVRPPATMPAPRCEGVTPHVRTRRAVLVEYPRARGGAGATGVPWQIADPPASPASGPRLPCPPQDAKERPRMFVHVVLFWLNDGAPEGARAQLGEECQTYLAKIPTVRQLWTGRPAMT